MSPSLVPDQMERNCFEDGPSGKTHPLCLTASNSVMIVAMATFSESA